MAAYHLQLTVAAVARPIHGSVDAPGVLAAERSWWCSPRRRLPGRASSRSRAVGRRRRVDPASRHATASVAAVQQAVSTHPGSASGIRLSSRPVSGHLGWSSSGSGARPSAVPPSGVRPCGVCPRPSGRVRILPRSGGGVGNSGRAGRTTVTTGTGGGPWGCRAIDGSIDGPGGRDAGDAAAVALVSGRSVADPGRRVGCWPRRPRLPAERPGRPGRARSAPRGRLRCGHGSRLQREVAAPAAWLPSSAGCATTVRGRRRA